MCHLPLPLFLISSNKLVYHTLRENNHLWEAVKKLPYSEEINSPFFTCGLFWYPLKN